LKSIPGGGVQLVGLVKFLAETARIENYWSYYRTSENWNICVWWSANIVLKSSNIIEE
jgi:hypothetical protein